MLVQEETRIKSKKNHPISYVSRQVARKNTNKKHDKKRKGSLKIIESSSQIHEREHHDDICRFFRKIRHVEKDCPKHKGGIFSPEREWARLSENPTTAL
ncbi:hypothetical protein Lal_00022713 [Lupinus albus]|nr:hypothetical protein Lal_00022713 [Lupinus albus]